MLFPVSALEEDIYILVFEVYFATIRGVYFLCFLYFNACFTWLNPH